MTENKIPEILTDEEFKLLSMNGFLSQRKIRDYNITKKYVELRKQNKTTECLRILKKDYPALQLATLDKIIKNNKNNFK